MKWYSPSERALYRYRTTFGGAFRNLGTSYGVTYPPKGTQLPREFGSWQSVRFYEFPEARP